MRARAEAVLGAPVVEAGVEFGALDADTHFAIGDLDVESREERSEQLAADVVGQLPVERGGIFEEIDEREGLVDPLSDALDRPGELLGDGALLERHVLEALAQFLDGDRSVGGEFDEPLFLAFELLELLAESVLLFLVRRLKFDESASNLLAYGRDVLTIEAFSRDPSRHLVFEFVESRRWHRAVTALLRGAHVVLIRAAMPLVLAVDESTRAPLRLAFGAVQQAAQEVEVDPVAVPLAVASVEDLLHREEQLLRDEGRVPARVELPLVADDSGVIRVAQDHGELAARQRLGGPLARLPRGQALVFEHHLKLRDRELIRGVLLEGPDDQWCADGVDIDRVDESSVEVLAHIQIAELGSPDAAASFDLVGHLDADVLAAHADLEFVDDVGDGLHRITHVAVAEVLLGRDQFDTLVAQLAFGDGSVEVIAEDTRAHVDHDVAHIRIGIDEAEELLELRPLVDGLRGLARFDELAKDRHAELLRLADRPLALSGDAVAVLVEVGCGVELARRGDAQVADCHARAKRDVHRVVDLE